MSNKNLARKIAKELFVNGAGKHAHRLVLEMYDMSDGGGYIESAVANVIEKILDEQTETQAPQTPSTPIRPDAWKRSG